MVGIQAHFQAERRPDTSCANSYTAVNRFSGRNVGNIGTIRRQISRLNVPNSISLGVPPRTPPWELSTTLPRSSSWI